MTTRAIRVTVRGFFDGLTDQQRAHLLAEAADHDVRYAQYTPDGHLTYEMAARETFAFRFLSYAENEAAIPDAVAGAELDVEAWLTERGYGYKRLTSTFADMSAAPVGARQRKLG